MKLNEIVWSHFLTPQEHVLLGSTVEPKYWEKYYTPINIQDRDGLNVAVVGYMREKCESFQAPGAVVRDEKGEKIKEQFVDIQLAPLDRNGVTDYDPSPVDKTLHILPRLFDKLKLRGDMGITEIVLYNQVQGWLDGVAENIESFSELRKDFDPLFKLIFSDEDRISTGPLAMKYDRVRNQLCAYAGSNNPEDLNKAQTLFSKIEKPCC